MRNMNVRSHLKIEDKSFSLFNREERNIVAVLYHLALINGNMGKLLDVLGVPAGPDPKVEMYFEFSYLRDAWNLIGKNEGSNERKRELIKGFLKNNSAQGLNTEAFNKYFGGRSKEHIENPANWVVVRFYENLKSNPADFLETCKFKWAFKIKPDLVLILPGNKAVCIEAKDESTIGYYPKYSKEQVLFNDMGIPYVRQTELQKYLMTDLLGFETSFFLIGSKEMQQDQFEFKSWNNVLKAMDTKGCPEFILRQMQQRLENH
jgi:hypothetical protein